MDLNSGEWREIADLNNIDHVAGTQQSDLLRGDAGVNTIDGQAGSDFIQGEGGNDTLRGGGGADRFVYGSINDGVDIILDFTRGPSGDVLDIHEVLQGHGSGSNLNDYVRLSEEGAGTMVSVNADGIGSDFVNLALLQGLGGFFLSNLLVEGNLIV